MAEIIPLPIPHHRATSSPVRASSAPEPLWRELLGGRLRRLRHDREGTLTDIAERAGISPQYLSEIERGIKEPSSEMIAAVAGALEVALVDLTAAVTEDLRRIDTARSSQANGRVSVALAA